MAKLSKEQSKIQIDYWTNLAKRDCETMEGLFKIKRYPESLFFAHIVLEKILKAHVVHATHEVAPKIHDLTRLSELANYGDLLSEEDEIVLDSANKYNIRARYPDYKLRFYKEYNANPGYVREKLDQIIKIYQLLCQNLKQRIKLKK